MYTFNYETFGLPKKTPSKTNFNQRYWKELCEKFENIDISYQIPSSYNILDEDEDEDEDEDKSKTVYFNKPIYDLLIPNDGTTPIPQYNFTWDDDLQSNQSSNQIELQEKLETIRKNILKHFGHDKGTGIYNLNKKQLERSLNIEMKLKENGVGLIYLFPFLTMSDEFVNNLIVTKIDIINKSDVATFIIHYRKEDSIPPLFKDLEAGRDFYIINKLYANLLNPDNSNILKKLLGINSNKIISLNAPIYIYGNLFSTDSDNKKVELYNKFVKLLNFVKDFKPNTNQIQNYGYDHLQIDTLSKLNSETLFTFYRKYIKIINNEYNAPLAYKSQIQRVKDGKIGTCLVILLLVITGQIGKITTVKKTLDIQEAIALNGAINLSTQVPYFILSTELFPLTIEKATKAKELIINNKKIICDSENIVNEKIIKNMEYDLFDENENPINKAIFNTSSELNEVKLELKKKIGILYKGDDETTRGEFEQSTTFNSKKYGLSKTQIDQPIVEDTVLTSDMWIELDNYKFKNTDYTQKTTLEYNSKFKLKVGDKVIEFTNNEKEVKPNDISSMCSYQNKVSETNQQGGGKKENKIIYELENKKDNSKKYKINYNKYF